MSEKQDEHKCPTDEVWNEEQNKCVAKTTEKSKTEEPSLMTRITAVIEDVMKTKLDAFEKKIDEKIEGILKTKEIEVEAALRKGFGLEQDPVVHMSDMITYGRKMALEKADTGKRTPGKEGEKGPEGTASTNPIDKMFEETRKGGLK